MSIEEFIKNITKEELAILNEKFAKRENKVSTYNYSNINIKELKKIINVKKILSQEVFNEWFNSEIKISNEDIDFLKTLLSKYAYLINSYKEETLKANFIIPIINRVDFLSLELEYSSFYEENITYEAENFIFTGTTDFLVSKGLHYSEKPYFFIQEFKRSKGAKDPEPQLVAELVSGVELNNWKTIKGAFIVGSIWNFVILEKLAKHKYQYFVSENFDSSKIDDLKGIYKNLQFVKQEINNIAKNSL